MATYYWVGGTGTWNETGNTQFAITSGGAPTLLNPNDADIVIFDSASGAGICTTDIGAICSAATFNTSTLVLSLGANLTVKNTFTLTLGTLDLASYTLTTGGFSSNNSNTRSVNFGTGKIILTTSGSVWVCSTLTNCIFTGSKNVELTYAGAVGVAINAGNTAGGSESTAVNFTVTAGSYSLVISNSSHVLNLIFTGFVGTLANNTRSVYGNLIFVSGMTLNTGTNAITFAATSGTQQITTNGKTLDFPVTQNGVGGTVQLQDNLTMGSTRTFNLTAGTLDLNNNTLSAGLLSSSNSNVRSILFGTTGQINLTGNAVTLLTISNSANLTTTGNKTVNATYSGSTGTRTVNASLAILETNAINFNVTAGSDSLSLQNNFLNLDLTGFSGTLTSNVRKIFYNFTIPSGVTITDGVNVTTLAGTTGTSTITTSGVSLLFPITVDGIGGTFLFNDALTLGSDKEFTVTNGIVKLKSGTTNTVGSFATTGTTVKYLQASTAGIQATLSDASGTNTLSYLTIKDINATGGATWIASVASNNVNVSNNTGWDFYLPADSIYDSLRLRGYTGTVTDMLLQYYQYNGATSNSIQDAEVQYLVIKGFTTGSNVDRWFAYLSSLGFTGTVSDMLFNYWKDPA